MADSTRTTRLATWAIAVAALLAIPLVFRWPWTATDFVFAAVLLFGAALAYDLVSRRSDTAAYRVAVGIAVAGGLLLVWINAAVGIIGAEDNPANLLYAGVLAVGLIGAGISRLHARGMSRTLFAMALAQMLVPVIALYGWRPSLDETPGIAGVFVLNAVFALLFVGSGLLFRRAAALARAVAATNAYPR